MINGTDSTTWEEQTLAMLKHAQEEKGQAESRVVYWTKLVESLQSVLELTKQRHIVKFDSHMINTESLRKKSVRESLVEIAKGNNGLLKASDAILILLKSDVYKDAAQARGTVYTILRRDHTRKGEHFVKERPGIYKLVSGNVAPLPMQI